MTWPLLAAVAAFLALSPALAGGFVNWDDEVSFLGNPHYRGLGWAQLRWMFTTTLLGHWSPLPWLTWGLDYALWGLDPRGYHLTSLALHAVNAALVYAVARRLIGAALAPASGGATTSVLADPTGIAPTAGVATTGGGPRVAIAVAAGALAAALLWGVHPLRAESVAWVSERRDVLCGLFYLLAVLAYLRGAAPGGGRVPGRWWVASLAAFAAALASKAIAMTLPLSLLVLDLYPLGRRRLGGRRLLIEKLPYAALGAVAAALAVATRQESGNITSYEQYGPGARVALAGHALWFYPSRLVWPAGLSPIYELPPRVDLVEARFLGPALAVVAVTAVLVVLRRRWPGGLAAWAHSAIVVAPVSGLVHSGNQLAPDRYSYISALGFAVLAGGILAWALSRARGRAPVWMPTAASATAAAMIVALGAATWAQAGVWRDSETLWRHALALDRECATCLSNLGRAIARPGRFDEAEALVRRAAELRPERPGPHENLGVIALGRGRPAEAEAHFRRVVAIRPAHAASRSNLGVALANQGRDAEAEAEFGEAARLGPRLPDGPANLGALHLRQERYAEAEPPLRAALALDASAARVRASLARALSGRAAQLAAAGRGAEAARLTEEAAALGRDPRAPR